MILFKISCFLLFMNTAYAVTGGNYIQYPEMEYGLKPSWVPGYYVEGKMIIPHSDVDEPFIAWYDMDSGNSRIDYHDGSTRTYHLSNKGEFGTFVNVVPAKGDTNMVKCTEIKGNDKLNISLQAVLPKFDKYWFEKRYHENEYIVEQWVSNVNMLGTIEKHEMWIIIKEDVVHPLRFVKYRFNSATQDYFENILIIYRNYTPVLPDLNVFDVEGLKCESSHQLGLDYAFILNPIMELIYDNITSIFDKFKSDYNKSYTIESEQHFLRSLTFHRNIRYIYSINRANVGFQLAVNRFTDYTIKEMKFMYGYKKNTKVQLGGRFTLRKSNYPNLQTEIDWRKLGAVTAVGDQGNCGSSWTFSTTGAVEGAYFKKFGELKHFSQQILLDCSWLFYGEGCGGGEDSQAYNWIKLQGIPYEDQYGPYLSKHTKCRSENFPNDTKITNFVHVPSFDEEFVKISLVNNGPMSIAIHASLKSFTFYSNGIYFDSQCLSSKSNLDHSALLVGYGTLDGEPYWLVKNSWSAGWGDDGYIRISRRNNTCGVLTSPIYVIM